MELAGTGIGVTCVHPGGIKTAIARSARRGVGSSITEGMLQQAARSFDRAARTTADEAARQIWRGVAQNQTRILIGPDARQIDWLTRLLPTRYTKLLRSRIEATFRTDG